MLRVRMLKDWSFHKAGDVVEVFDPTGRNWILNGIAEEPRNERSLSVEEAVSDAEGVERAVIGKRPAARKP